MIDQHHKQKLMATIFEILSKGQQVGLRTRTAYHKCHVPSDIRRKPSISALRPSTEVRQKIK